MPPITRSQFLRQGTRLGLAALLALSSQLRSTSTALAALAEAAPSRHPLAAPGHDAFLQALGGTALRSEEDQRFLHDYKALLTLTARLCVQEDGGWIVPGGNYPQSFFTRDSFWTVAGLNDAHLSAVAVGKLGADQKKNRDGHAPTAIFTDGTRPDWKDRDDESTIIYILFNYMLHRLGGKVDPVSLKGARDFVLSHIADGKYVTLGETREFPGSENSDTVGGYHYWADTYRPNGRGNAPEVVTYNQGLMCVALHALKQMGVEVPIEPHKRADAAYAAMASTANSALLPQREGADVMDVSALVGEALSLYLFDRPLLPQERVAATLEWLNRSARVEWPDGGFLGFKVLSDATGEYLSPEAFCFPEINSKGDYQNGGSWLLYDSLALYAGARHGVPGCVELFLQRMRSDVKEHWGSHEFLSTGQDILGTSTPDEIGYGWNAFLINLIP